MLLAVFAQSTEEAGFDGTVGKGRRFRWFSTRDEVRVRLFSTFCRRASEVQMGHIVPETESTPRCLGVDLFRPGATFAYCFLYS
jgi:hypothetical protein